VPSKRITIPFLISFAEIAINYLKTPYVKYWLMTAKEIV
jgi:hypothetical protein